MKKNISLKLKVLFVSLFACVYAFGEVHIAKTDDWMRREAFVDPAVKGEDITRTWRGGEWQDRNIEGDFRFVITSVKPGVDKLYIQWWVNKPEGEELAYSLSVKEFNAHPEYGLTLPSCLDGDACRTVSVVAKHSYEETEQVFRLTFDKVGYYRFSL